MMFRRLSVAFLGAMTFTAAAIADRAGLVSLQRVAIPQDVPANLCSAIAQDREGLLWFGTQGGLVRYDGYEFRVFKSNPSDPSTIAGNYVRSMLVASDGRLWVGTFSGGLSVYDARTETFTRFHHDAANPRSLAYDRVEGLAETSDGRIWIATTAGLDRLDPRTRQLEHFRHDPADPRSLAHDRVRGLLVDRTGRLWVGTRDGLQRWLGEGRGFARAGMDGQYVIHLFEDARGRIWIGTEEHGAAVLDPMTNELRRFAARPADPNGLSHYWIYGFAEGAPGELWIATFGGGIDIIDEATLTIVDRLHADPYLDDALHDDRIGAIFRDRAGVVWIGTWGDGIARHDPRTRAFRALRFSPNRVDGLTHRAAVRALELRDGTIWVGTNGNGIDVFDRTFHRIGGFRANANDPGALADGSVTCLAQSDDGSVWVATLNSMLHRMRPGTRRFERIDAARLPGGPIRTMAFTSDGVLWAGAAEGMARVDLRTMETRVFRTWPGGGKSSPAIESIVAARDGTLWVGSDNGLYAFDPRAKSAIRIARDASRADALPDNWVPDLMLARDGRLWVGTAGGAAILTRWDGRTAHFDHVSARLGRTPSTAEALVEDAGGAVWIGPRLRVDATARGARELGPADGVAFRNFFIGSRSRMRDGRLLFGSPEGLLVVDPTQLPRESDVVPIVATALRVEGKPRAGSELLRALRLSSTERNFTLDVAALDFVAAARQQYRYRLDGVDANWTLAGASQRSITYSRLPPGDFVLRVGATMRDGRWSARELRIPIHVAPAFHQTLWFQTLASLALLALAYAAYRLRVRQLHAREQQLEALVVERTSELAEKNRQLGDAYVRIEEASLTDPLTRLRNRRYLEQTIHADLALAARGEGDLIALLIDLDHFKNVNDTYGHAAGDAVLAELARLLQHIVRASDVIVRWGGEEFLIVIRFVDRILAGELAEKVRAAVAAHEFTIPGGMVLRRTCSIGVAAWPFARATPDAVTWERVIDVADGALYAAKRSGRNAWVEVFATSADAATAVESFRTDPAHAVEHEEVAIATSLRARELVWESAAIAR
ncbi:MAG: diguanylate cyclase with beta propeller sensor [Acidobacteria bacterium]|nr:diguanylate cyclase with beta propeller sensor [Acidobacteriota bacterium]